MRDLLIQGRKEAQKSVVALNHGDFGINPGHPVVEKRAQIQGMYINYGTAKNHIALFWIFPIFITTDCKPWFDDIDLYWNSRKSVFG